MSKIFLSNSSPETLSKKIAVGFEKIGQVLKNKAWQEGFVDGVTPTQGQILSFLLNRRSDTETSLTDIVDHLAVSAATVSEAVHILESKGLVIKKFSVEDRRCLVISLSASGRRLAQRASGWPDFLMTSIESLSDDEQAVFFRALIKIIKTLQDEGEISLVPMCATCRYFQPYVYKDKEKPHHCGFVDAAFGHKQYQMQCRDHAEAPRQDADKIWRAFVNQHPVRM